MTSRERENITLSFGKPSGMGSAEETFFPWKLTAERFRGEGLPDSIYKKLTDIVNNLKAELSELEKYFNVLWGEGIMEYEKYLGFDPVRRVGFTLPFRRFEVKTLEDTEDWKRLKEHGEKERYKYYTRSNINKAYLPLKNGHEKGEFPVRLNIEGFFWAARELMGIGPHLFAFYDSPELLHDINEYILDIYLTDLVKVLDVLAADIIYKMEDLSGKNGPMLSPSLFDEFVGSYYKRLIPVLKNKGVRHVFVDKMNLYHKSRFP